jgi:hypothetical protein
MKNAIYLCSILLISVVGIFFMSCSSNPVGIQSTSIQQEQKVASTQIPITIKWCGPVVGTNANGLLDLFATGTDQKVYFNHQSSPKQWSGWSALSNCRNAEFSTVAKNSDGRLELFFQVPTGSNPYVTQLHHVWQQSAGSSSWTSDELLSSTLLGFNMAVSMNFNNNLEIFAQKSSAPYSIVHAWQIPGTGWSTFEDFGNPSSGWKDFRAAQDANNKINVFCFDCQNKQLYYKYCINTGIWSPWTSLGGSFFAAGSIAPFQVQKNKNGQLEIFAIGANKTLVHNWQMSPGSTSWSGWYSLGNTISEIGSVVDANGWIQIFARASDNTCHLIYQTSAGSWSSWQSLNGNLSNIWGISAAKNADNRLEVFIKGTDSYPWHNYRTSASGGWFGWTKSF